MLYEVITVGPKVPGLEPGQGLHSVRDGEKPEPLPAKGENERGDAGQQGIQEVATGNAYNFV